MPTEKPGNTENWVSCDDGIHLIQMNENYSHYGWVFRKIEGGWPYSVRKATEHEMAHAKARQHLRAGAAQVTAQYQPAERHREESTPALSISADPGEVERPSQIALSLQTKLKSVESERDRLRAKLAEQEHSARELLRIIGMSVQGSAAYNRAVIAFHDSLNADTKPN
ncbi:hypothetical protein QEP73_13750 [Pseudomonas defluvii]|nr:hypothetical protein QEP73_13750 [Pseudomonas defluvii]